MNILNYWKNVFFKGECAILILIKKQDTNKMFWYDKRYQNDFITCNCALKTLFIN